MFTAQREAKVRFSFLPDECCVYLGPFPSISFFSFVRGCIQSGKMELAVTWQSGEEGKKKKTLHYSLCCVCAFAVYPAICVLASRVGRRMSDKWCLDRAQQQPSKAYGNLIVESFLSVLYTEKSVLEAKSVSLSLSLWLAVKASKLLPSAGLVFQSFARAIYLCMYIYFPNITSRL